MTNQILKQKCEIDKIIRLMESFNIRCNDTEKMRVALINSLDSIYDSFLYLLAFGFERGIFFTVKLHHSKLNVLKLFYCLLMAGFNVHQSMLVLRILKMIGDH